MNTETLLKQHGIDPDETMRLIRGFNTRKQRTSTFAKFPSVDGEQVISAADLDAVTVGEQDFDSFLESYLPGFTRRDFSCPEYKGRICIDAEHLRMLGILLYPVTAYGILNGGSATSYIDSKKNRAYGDSLFSKAEQVFRNIVPLCSNKPKGSSPGFINPKGTAGPSFMYLKIRSLMIESLRYRNLMKQRFPKKTIHEFGIIPLFQMTSTFTHDLLNEEIESVRKDPHHQDLLKALRCDDISVRSAVQPLAAACTYYEPGKPVDLFLQAWGTSHTPLPLPAGHGQNFSVLKDIYRELHREGKQFAYLGNIDNLGNTLHPVHLALTALRSSDASFEFSFKTPVDVKGGVLVKNSEGKLDCMDIGPGIDMKNVQSHIDSGHQILFNCATGLFNLSYLSSSLDDIVENLPLRISNQEKDAGRYSQIEQITWEVIGIMDNPLVIGVNKNERFMAAKLLIEQILTSLAPALIEHPGNDENLRSFHHLHGALNQALKSRYQFNLSGDQWTPLPSEAMEI